MYGMIHKAAREMALQEFGEAGWTAILASAGLNEEHFISAQTYPDDVTQRLIDAIIAHGDYDPDTLLEAFGRYWVHYAGGSRYAKLMDMAGSDLESFLANLDRMHDGVKASMPEAILPSFELVDVSPHRLKVAYRSTRSSLTLFVKGLLLALMDRFGESGTVTCEQQGDSVLFEILREPAKCAA